ncbi:alkaline phosphatase D [Muriicola jejuensis]|uniref:Alkaline phosphatase family protein n=1 Tax=Muriicola jejuensis TaxID=504488 RepID=A0A6P0UKR0_9FLAO|nr:alkaline phosphatase D family protein [Muriicola jejuensis]NER10816.1 alkaline phosphatase family protein [Muriicola jejuensis]SMP16210.1 alkaline phosphatase D [Muriicola jejuensis]
MKRFLFLLTITFLLVSCKSVPTVESGPQVPGDFTIAFGSCNKHTLRNRLWDDVLAARPDVWIWGGDIVYADTPDTARIAAMYTAQKEVPGYSSILKEIPVIGTWDDHDYGLNDGGVEFESKKGSQQVFLDFLGVGDDDTRRAREGVYASHDYPQPEGKVKVLVLDTRYFRTALTPSVEKGRRYQPGTYGEGTILGEAQWEWLKEELNNSDADFNVIVSSIQVLSAQHGFETWGNFPHEVDRLGKVIANSGARGVIILSGDRHISEFSRIEREDLDYPLVDFTSSGLTHVYTAYSGEPNPYRVGEVVSERSFGLLRFDLEGKRVHFQIVGDEGKVLGELTQQY